MHGRPLVTAVIVAATLFGIVSIEPPAAQARIRVLQDQVRPGEPVEIDVRDGRFKTGGALRAVFGKTGAPVRVIAVNRLEVIVPPLPVGQTTVSVYQGRRLLGQRSLEVLDTATRRLMFSYNPDGVTLLRTMRSAGTSTGHVRSRAARISFDLVNANGVVVHSGAIADPAQTRPEVMAQSLAPGGPAVIGRGEFETSGVFFVEIPTPPGRVELRLYRADAGLDLFTVEGRSQRRLLTTVGVTP